MNEIETKYEASVCAHPTTTTNTKIFFFHLLKKENTGITHSICMHTCRSI